LPGAQGFQRHTGARSMKILIVDDDENSRVLLERALTRRGYLVECASNGVEALEKALQSPPELIVSDIMLPEMDGFELCRRVKTDDRLRTVPFIFYTAVYVDKKDEDLALQLGASRFLLKPLEPADFLRVIREVVEEHLMRKLPVPDRPLATMHDLDRMQLEAVARKLEQKVHELADERDALQKSEQKYQQLTETLEQRIALAVEEARTREQLFIRQGRLAAMGEMIGNIAHQWRQPLNILALIIQELPVYYERDLFTKPYLDATVHKAMQVISQMSKTIDSFRNFFRPDKEKVCFQLREVLEKTVSIVDAVFTPLNLTVETVVEDEIAIDGYPNEFSQVILNILLNAKDAFLHCKVEQPKVIARLFRENGKAVLTITDNAGGIPEEIMPSIFDPYFSTKGPDKGTGIGLFMSKAIIEKNMNGTLSARNVDGGAEFRIEIYYE